MNRPSDFLRALDDILTLVINDKKKQAVIDSVICVRTCAIRLTAVFEILE